MMNHFLPTVRCNNGGYFLAAVNFPLEIFHDFPNSTTGKGL